eukprot:5378013-Pyramimonas_sp.AAC.1
MRNGTWISSATAKEHGGVPSSRYTRQTKTTGSIRMRTPDVPGRPPAGVQGGRPRAVQSGRGG